MNQTVVGAFDSQDAAERAASELERQGFDRSQMRIQATDAGTTTSTGTSSGTTSSSDRADEGTGVMASIRHFFSELFGDESEHAGHYSEAVRRGGAVLTVDTDDSRLDLARDALTSAGAVDIEERVSNWRSQGWSGDDADAAPYARDQAAAERENVIPVVREELEVGKRQVSGGAVRVVSRVVSQPVSESVELRREEATIERRPVEREASQADLAALQERTVEVAEMAEKAVVNKTAHVVEEVVVGKRVSSETQQVEDTVRHTEVDVERVGAGDRAVGRSGGTSGGDVGTAAGGGLGTAGGGVGTAAGGSVGAAGGDAGTATGGGIGAAMGGGSRGATSGSAGGGIAGATSGAATSGRRGFSDYEDEFRQDYQTNYASAGGSYEDYQPAYRGGYELRSDSRFAGRDWNEAEPELRQRWESENPNSAWERVKAAVRRGWDRATS